MNVVCDSCRSRLQVPEGRVSDRGAKLRCPTCGAIVVIFPSENVAMAADAEPTTEDHHHAFSRGVHVPEAIREMFDGEHVHPMGTAPPVMRQAAPVPFDSKLSVTPPPPRAARGPLTPAVSMLRGAQPPEAPAVGTVPPARRHGTIPPPALRYTAPPAERRTQPAPDARMSYGGAYPTASPAQNRTGPTGGPSPSRATFGEQPVVSQPPMSYAPPWGATHAGTPMAAPMASYAGPHHGTPLPAYGAPGTGSLPPGMTVPPVGTVPPALTVPPAMVVQSGPPMVTTWQPQWVPAVVLGMERSTLALLLAVVFVVGFGGAGLAIVASQMFANETVAGPPVVVPGTPYDSSGRPMRVAPVPLSADELRPVDRSPAFNVEKD